MNFNHFKISFSAWFNLDQIYQLAADMGCAAYLFGDKNDVQIMRNLISINVNLLSDLLFQESPSSMFLRAVHVFILLIIKVIPGSPLCNEESVLSS